MDGMTDIPARLEALRRKLAARENRPGLADNVAALRAEIERLERMQAHG